MDAQNPLGDILDYLGSSLSPDSADAASAPNSQFLQVFKALQTQAHQKALENEAAQAMALKEKLSTNNLALRTQTANEKNTLATQKAEAPQLQRQQLMELLGGGNQAIEPPGLGGDVIGGGPGAPITYGINPRTGIPSFNNFGWTQGGTENLPANQLQIANQLNTAATAPGGPLAGGQPSPQAQPAALDTAKQRAVMAATLKGQLPEAEIKNFLNAQFPTLKELPVEKLSKLFKFNRDNNTFQAAPDNLTSEQARNEGYRFYDQKQRDAVAGLADVKDAFSQLNGSLADIQPKSASSLLASQITGGNIGGPEGAVYQKSVTNFTTIFDKFLGGVRGAASPQMQAIRSKILPQFYSTGAVSDKLMGQLKELIDTMSQSRIDTSVGAAQNYDLAGVNKKADAVIRTFNEQGGKVAGITSTTTPLTSTSKSGRAITSTDGGKTWTYK